MMVQWNEGFESSQMVWLLLATIILGVTFLPAAVVLLTRGRCLKEFADHSSQWFLFAAFHASTWLLFQYSLAFGPSLGQHFGEAVAGPPAGLETMIRQAESTDDKTHVIGRGGVIGNLEFAGFRGLAPEGNEEQPLFSSRRPHHHVSHVAFLNFHLVLYLSVAMVIGAQARRLMSPSATLIFTCLWGTLIYAPTSHWVWGDGWLGMRGALDAGGGLLPLTLGVSSLALTVFRTGPLTAAETDLEPVERGETQIPAASLILYWLGSIVLISTISMPSPHLRAIAMLNGILAPCAGLLTYAALLLIASRRSHQFTTTTGILTGLSAVAPGCTVFDPQTAVIVAVFGALAAFGVWSLVARLRPTIDLEIPCALVSSSVTGLLAVGIFGNSATGVFHWDKSPIRSLILGESDQLVDQMLTAVAVAGFVFLVTAALLWVIPKSRQQSHTSLQSSPIEPTRIDQPESMVIG